MSPAVDALLRRARAEGGRATGFLTATEHASLQAEGHLEVAASEPEPGPLAWRWVTVLCAAA